MKPKRKTDKNLLAEIRKLPCICCGGKADHAHHVKTRGSGGHDDAENVMPLCANAHSLIHAMGTDFMARAHHTVHDWLIANGWERDPVLFRWRRR